MKSKLVLVAGAAMLLSACASFAPNTAKQSLVLSNIVPGVSTRADVEAMTGKPVHTFVGSHSGSMKSTYEFKDKFGYDSELVVRYNKNNVVEWKVASRDDY